MSKLGKSQLPGNIYNWIGAFLSNRDQICRYSGFVLKSATCNRGFVQGSGLGPTLFVVLTLDLNTVHVSNVIVKFADDSTLIVPENSDVEVEIEFNITPYSQQVQNTNNKGKKDRQGQNEKLNC